MWNQTDRIICFLIALVYTCAAWAQCDPTVPVFTTDLSASPSATWQSPLIARQGLCCGTTGPAKCIEFIITLHPDAQGIVFDVCAGAVPSGAMYYQIDCGPPTAVGTPLCLSGAGPFILTFCKPGNNINAYCITSIAGPTAGPDIAVNDGCQGTITTNGFAPGTVQWSSIAPGSAGAYDNYLGCPTCANTVVTAQPGYPAYVDYRVCGNAVSPCSDMIFCDTVRVWFNSTLGGTILPQLPTVCYGAAGTTITVNGSGGTPPYSYLWNTGATTASIFVGPGTYTVQVSDTTQCPPTSTSVTVTQFQQLIEALAGPDILVCGGTGPAAVPLNGSVTGAGGGQWTGGSGSFQPNANVVNATYTPTLAEIASGTVQLLLTTTGNGTCPGDTDDLTIAFAAPFANMGLLTTDATCSGSANGSITVVPTLPGWTYAWPHAPQLNSAVASGLGAGPYSVTVMDPSGCDTTLTVTIIAPQPISIADVAVTPETCAGLGDGSVSVNVNGGTSPYSYAWNNSQTGPSITVGAGTWTVQVSDANGCAPATGTGTVVAEAQPNVANAGADRIGCTGDLPVALNGSVINATGGTWSGGTGTFLGSGLAVQYQPSTAEILANGVDLVLTTSGNTNCPSDQDLVHITLPTSFFGSALGSTALACNGDHSGSATFTPGNSSFTYLWNDALAHTTATATGLSAGTYTVHVTDNHGCDTTASVVITEPAPLSAANVTANPPSCFGGSNGSASVQPAGGTPVYSYLWSTNANGQTTSTAVGLPSGAYTVVVTDANGCQAQATAITPSLTPIAFTAQVDDTVCVNTPVPLTAQASGGAGGYTITWAGIGTGDSLQYSFPATQVVHVSVVDQAGCIGPMLDLPVTVLDISLATLHTYGDTAVCPGGSATVGAWLTGYPGTTSLTWPQLPATGNGPFTLQATSSRTLTVIATDACSNSLQATIVITVETPPEITLPPVIAEGCEPLTAYFPTGLTNQPVSYFWSFGDGSTSTSMVPVHVYSAGNYTVSLTVTTPLGCSAAALTTGAVHAYADPIAAFTANPWETDADHADVQFTDHSTGAISTWNWNFGDGGSSIDPDPEHHYLDPGTWQVSLQVTDDHGCTGSVDHIVTVVPVYDITIPNAFTPDPNGGSGGGFDPMDLSNDVFYPFVRFVKDFRMRLFNRWGELVFESNDIKQGWDGYYRGHPSQQDVYVYQVWVRFVDNKEVQRMGDVTLFR